MRRGFFGVIFLASLLIISFIVFSNNNQSITSTSCTDCNVIIVGYDTVGAKHVSSLGYNKKTTPSLDKLASEGFSFKNNFSTAPWTVPGFMSVFTGLYPTQHKIVNKYTVYNSKEQTLSNLGELSPKVETLAQQFKNNGYVTGGFTADSGVSAKFGYDTGFDTYYETPPFGSFADSSAHALDWIKQNEGKKFFMFLHGYDAHGQFKTSSDFTQTGKYVYKDYSGNLTGTNEEEQDLREKQLSQPLNLSDEDAKFLTGIYDSKIYDGDTRFGNFWDELKSMGLDKDTIVVVVADHGEEWNEHGGVDHGHTLYNELVNVPLVFKFPSSKSHATYSQQVSSLDIAPTLIDATGINASDQYKSQIQGTSLLPLFNGAPLSSSDVYLETDYLDYTHIRGVIDANGWKYIRTEQTGDEELYNLNNDPGEQNNLINDKLFSDIAENLRLKVRDHLISMGDNPDKLWTTGCLPVYPNECN